MTDDPFQGLRNQLAQATIQLLTLAFDTMDKAERTQEDDEKCRRLFKAICHNIETIADPSRKA